MTAPIRALIVDDEPLARAAIRALCAEDPEIAVVGDCIGADAPGLIERFGADLLFLDVQMPEVDGFQVLEALAPAPLPATIFVTAHDAYAVRAFEVHAIDYLLKPFDDARFFKALARAKHVLRSAGAAAATEQILALLGERSKEKARGEGPVERFLVRARGRVVVVRANEVDWIEAADYYATLHAGGASHLVRQTMADLENSLDPRRFVRVHRGAIVNIDRVREVHPLFRGDCTLVLEDGTQVRLSRTRRGEFERLFAAPRSR
ncbi:MAG: LytTR family DNA-binding domain-containing protein [Minicystis sp.]